MFKTKKRVIALILAALMVLSMVSVFAFAEGEAPAFADSYQTKYKEKYGKDAVIENTALLVDNSITTDEQTAASFTRTWDGIEFSFKYSENAFTTIESAYASAKFVKDIIVLGIASSTSASLSISKPSRVFSPAWDMVPMNEMGDSFNAIASNGADWTVNTAYSQKAIEVNNLYYTNALTSGTAEVYGFAVNNVIGWGGAYNAFRTPNVNSPVTMKFINGIFKAPTNALFYYKYGNAQDNNDTIEIKNVYMNGAKNFDRNADNPHMPANVILDGFYYDMANTTANNFFQSKATNSSITIKNSYLKGSTTHRFCISHNNHLNLATAERVVTLHNNVFKHAASDGMLYMEPHNTSKIIVTNNFIDKTADGGAYLINSTVTLGSGLTGSQEKTITFTGNKIVGYKNAFNTKLTNAFTINNNFLTSATGDAAKTAIGVSLSSPSGHTGNYYYDYAMTKSSSAFPLADGETAINGVPATVDNANSTITVSGAGEISASDFVNNNTSYSTKIDTELGERKSTLVKPTVTIENTTTNQSVVAINTAVAGNYKVTVAYEGIDSKTYTLNVGDLSAPAFDDETEGYKQHDNGPSKDAILLDSNLSGEASDSVVIKEWEGTLYSFIVGSNAFATYTEAETAATANGASKQIIVTAIDGSAITATKAVSIYSPNWNTEPFVRDNQQGDWKAVNSNGYKWEENTSAWKNGFVVNGVTIATSVSNLGIYGFDFTNSIMFTTPSAGSAITTATVEIKNNKFNKATHVMGGAFSVANSTKLDVINLYVKDATDLIGANNVPAFTTFDGLFYDISDMGRNNYFQVPKAVTESSVVIKNSCLFGTALSNNIKMSHANQATLTTGTREATFDNNVLLYKQTSGIFGMEAHDTTSLVITDNYIDKTGDKNASLINPGVAVGGRKDFVNAAERTHVEFTGNKIIGYQSSFASVLTNDFTPANNFVTTATGEAAKTATGVELKSPVGKAGAYYYDYGMTMSNVSLTLETGKFGDVDVTVGGTNIAITGTSGTITKEQIIANAMTDAPEDSAEPKVTITDINKKAVDDITLTQAPTLYNIKVEFEGYDSIEYILDVNDFKSTVSAFNAKQDTEDTVIKNTAVLVDSTIADGEETIYREWDGTWYSFTVNTNAFDNYSEAETAAVAANSENPQVIITDLNSADITIAKPVKIYGKNYMVNPVTVGEQGAATTKFGSDWGYNTEYDANEVIANSISIAAGVTGAVEIYGITINSVFSDTARSTGPVNITLYNVKFNGTTTYNFDLGNSWARSMTNGAQKTDSFTVKNAYINFKAGTSVKMFNGETANPNITFDTVYINGNGKFINNWLKYGAGNASFTIKNSYLKDIYTNQALTFTGYYIAATGGTAAALLPEGTTNTITFENNVMVGFEGNANSLFNIYPESYSEITVKNNYVEPASSHKSINMFYTPSADNGFTNDCEVEITDNVFNGMGSMQIGSGEKHADSYTWIVKDNFVLGTKVADVHANGVVGVDHKDSIHDVAKAGYRYYFDAAKTMSNAALTLQNGEMGDATNVTVDGTNVAVTGTSGTVTVDDIIANAAADKPEGGVNADTVTIKDVITGESVTEIDLTTASLFNVTVKFDGYASEEYLFNVNDYNVTAFVNKSNDGETIKSTAVLVDTDLTDAEEGDTVYKKWDGTVYSFTFGTNAFATYADAEAKVNEANPQVIVTGWNGSALNITRAVSVYTPNWNTVPMLEMADEDWSATASNGADWTKNDAWISGFVANGLSVASNINAAVYGFEYRGTIAPTSGASGVVTVKNSKFNAATNIINVAYSTNTAELNIVNMYVENATNLLQVNQTKAPAHVVIDGLYFNVSKLTQYNYFQVANTVTESSVTIKNSYLFGTSNFDIKMSHAGSATKTSGTREFTFDNNVLMFKQPSGMLAFEPHDTTLLAITNNYIDKTDDKSTALISSAAAVGGRSGFVNAAERVTVEFTGNKIVGFTDTFGSAITNDFTPANNYVYGTAVGGVYGTGYALAGPTGKIGDYYLDYDMTVKNSELAITGFKVGNESAGTINGSFAVVNGYMDDADGLYNVTVALANGNNAVLGGYYYDAACTQAIDVENLKADKLAEKGNVATVYYKVTYNNGKKEIVRDDVYTVVVLLEQPVEFTGTIDGITGETVVYTPWKGVTILPDNTYYSTFKGTVYKFTINGSTVYANNTTAPSADFAGKNVILPAGEFGNINVAYGANFYGSNYGVNPNDKSTASAANNFDWEFNTAWDQVNSTKVGTITFNANNATEQELSFNGITMQGTYQDTVRTTAAAKLDTTFTNIVYAAETGTVMFNANSGRAGRAIYGWNLNSTSPVITEPPTETWANDYNDSIEFKNVRITKALANFHVINEAILPNTTLDGIYFDADDIDASIYTDIGVIKNGPFVGQTELNIINSNFRGSKLYSSNGRPFIYISGIHSNDKVIAENTYNVNISNNIMFDVASGTAAFVTFNGLDGRHASKLSFNNNVVIESDSSKTNNLFSVPSGTNPVVEEVEINDNKFVGFAKSKLNDSVLKATTSSVYADTFATEETDAHKTPTELVGYEINEGTDYFFDYNMTKSSAALTLQDENEVLDVDGSTVSVLLQSGEITKAQIIANAMLDAGETTEPIVTIKDINGGTAESIEVGDEATLYNVEIGFEGTGVSQKYLFSVNEFIENVTVFSDKDDTNDTIKKSAVLVDVNITENDGETIYRKWDGTWYSFTVGTNAFSTYDAAQTKALAGGRQVMLYSFSGTLTVTATGNGLASFQIFGKNWNTTPYTRDVQDGEWSALKSSSSDWAYNTAYDANEIVVNSLAFTGGCMDKIEVYGITIDGLYNDGQRWKQNARSGDITLNNVKFNGNVTGRLFHMHNGYNNTLASAQNSTDSLTIKNSYITFAEGKTVQLFGDGSVAANITFDGVFMDGTNRTLGASYLKYRAVNNASFTIENSCFKNVYGDGQVLSLGGYYSTETGSGNGAAYPEGATNTVTYNNNVFDAFAGYGSTTLINSYAAGYTAFTVTNNNITSKASGGHLFYTLQVAAYPAFAKPATVTVTGNILNGYGDMGIGTGGAYPNDSVWTGNFTGNFLSPTKDGTIGKVYNNPDGLTFGTSNYAYYDAAMTMKSSALTLQNGAMGEATVVVGGSGVEVTGENGTITADNVKENAMLDAVGSAEPVVTIKDISGQTVDGVDITKQGLYTVTIEFENYALEKYTFVVNGYNINVFAQRPDEDETIKNTAILVDTNITEQDGETVYREWDGEWYSFVAGENAFATYAKAEEKAATTANPQIIVTGWDGSKLSVTTSVSIYTPNWDTVPMLEMADGFNALTSNGADWNENGEWKSGFVANGLETTVTNIDVGVYGFEYTDTIVPKHNGTSGRTIIKNSIFNNESADLINIAVANATAYSLDIVNMRADKVKNLMSQNAMPAFLTIDGLYLNIENFNRNNYLQAHKTVTETSVTLKDSYIYGTNTNWGFAFSHVGAANANSGYRDNIITNNVLKYNASGALITVEPHDTTKFELTGNFMDFAAATTDYIINTNTAAGYHFGSRVTEANPLHDEISVVVENNKIVNYKTDNNAPATNFATQIQNNNTITPVNNYVYGAAVDGVYGKGYALAGTNGTTVGDYYLDYDMTIKNSDIVISGYEVGGQSAGTVDGTVAVVNGYMQDADGLYNVTVKLANGNEDTTGKYYYDELCTEEVTAENRKAAELAKRGKVVKLYYKVTKGEYTRVYTVVVLLGQPTDYTGTIEGIEDETVVYTPWKGVTILPDNTYYSTVKDTVYKFTIDGSTVYANSGANLPEAFAGKNVILPAGEFGNLNITFGVNFIGSNFGINPNDKSTATADNNFDWAFNEAWDQINATGVGAITVAQTAAAGTLSLDGVAIRDGLDDSKRNIASNRVDITIKNSIAQALDTPTQIFFLNFTSARTKNGYSTTAGNTEFGSTYADEFTIENLRVDVWNGKSFRFINEFTPAITEIKGMYYNTQYTVGENELADNAIYPDLGFFKTGKDNKVSKTIITESNFRSNGKDGSNRPILFFVGAYAELADGFTNEFEFSDNISFNQFEADLFNSAPNTYSSVKINDNVIINQTGKSYNVIKSYAAAVKMTAESPLAQPGALEFDGNKFVGFSASNFAYDLGEFNGEAAKFTNTFATEATDAHKTPDAMLGYAINEGTDYYVNFGAPTQVYNGELTIKDVTSNSALVIDPSVTGDQITFVIDQGGDPETALSFTYAKTVGGVTGTWGKTDGAYTSYTVTSKAVPSISKTYTVSAMTEIAEVFTETEDDLGEISKSDAVIFDAGLEGKNKDDIVVSEWKGTKYKFVFGTNAFSTYTEAEAKAATTTSKQLLIADWNASDALTVTKAVNIYTSNWDVEPFVRDAGGYDDQGKWHATKSNGGEWTENTTTWDDSFKANGLVISNAINDTVTVKGFEFTNSIKQTAKRATGEGKAIYNIVNCKFDGAARVVDMSYQNIYEKQDELNITNMYVKNAKYGLFNGSYVVPNITLDGLCVDFANITAKANQWFDATSKESTFTIKNSYIVGEYKNDAGTLQNFKPSVYRGYKAADTEAGTEGVFATSRVVTYENNTFAFNSAGGMIVFEQHDTTNVVIKNNFMDKNVDGGDYLIDGSEGFSLGQRVPNVEKSIVFEGNKIVGLGNGFAQQFAVAFTPKDNFVYGTLEGEDDTYEGKRGYALAGIGGSSGRYWLDYNMTMSSAALTMQTAGIYTVDGEVVHVGLNATVTADSIIENAMIDAGTSVRPTVLLDGTEFNSVTTSTSKLYTITLEFEGLTISTYTLNVGNYQPSLAFEFEPFVLISGDDEYNIVWGNNVNSVGYVTIGGTTYYDEEDGIARSDDNIHSVRVPQSALNSAKKYSVYAEAVIERNGNNISTKDFVAEKENINFDGYDQGEEIEFAAFSDTHYDPADSSEARNTLNTVYNRVNTGVHKNADVIILNGDIVEQLSTKDEYYALFDYMYYASAKGTRPVIYNIGNHEKRGSYTKELEKYITFDTGETYGRVSFGPASILVIDSGEDKDDYRQEYGYNDGASFTDMEHYFAEELKWLQESGGFDESKTYTFTLSHTPTAICYNYGTQRADFLSALGAYGTDLVIGGHVHTNFGLNPVGSVEAYAAVPAPVIIPGYQGTGKTFIWSNSYKASSSKIVCSGSQYAVTYFDQDGSSVADKSGTTGTIAPAAQALSLRQNAAAQPETTVATTTQDDGTVQIPTRAGISTKSLKSSAARATGIVSGPVVFEGGDYYSVVWQTDSSTKYAGYVQVQGVTKYYNASTGGKLRYGTTHSARIPKDVLAGKKYTVKNRTIANYNAYGYHNGAEVGYGSWINGAQIQFNALPTGNSPQLTVLAVANKQGGVADAQALVNEYTGTPDMLVMLGNMAPALNTEQDFGDYILGYAAKVTGGKYPVVFTRGDGEAKGAFAANVSRYINVFSPTDGAMNTLYTGEQYGDRYSFVALDTPTDNGAYANFSTIRAKQASWLANQNAQTEYKLAFANSGANYATTLNGNGTHLTVSAGSDSGDAALNKVAVGSGSSTATVGNSLGLVITCGNERIRVDEADGTYKGSIVLGTAPTFADNYQNATIKGTAILVDTGIVANDQETIIATWDNAKYSFTYGVNAFNSLEAALEKVDSTNPQIIMTGWNGGDLILNQAVSIYTPAWDTVPMTEMEGAYDPIASKGADWNENSEFNNRALNVANVVFGKDIAADVGLYGFIIKKPIFPAGGDAYSNARTTAPASPITYTIKNSRIDHTTAGQTFAGHYLANVDNQDTLNFTNVQYKNVQAVIGDRALHANVNFEKVYIDLSKVKIPAGNTAPVSNSYFKTGAINSTLTLDSCNIQGTTTSNFTFAFSNNRNIDGSTRQINLTNNALCYKAGTGTTIFVDDYNITGLSIVDNYVDMSNSGDSTAFVTTNSAATSISTYKDGFVVTDNKIVGFKRLSYRYAFSTDSTKDIADESLITIENNYATHVLSVVDGAETDFTNVKGGKLANVNGVGGDYYLDYAMSDDMMAYDHITVNVSWGAMEFNFTETTWNTETYTWDGEWTAKEIDGKSSNFVTVDNVNYTDVNATVEFAVNDQSDRFKNITGLFVYDLEGEDESVAKAVLDVTGKSLDNVASEPKSAYLSLAGGVASVRDWTEQETVGSLTVTIDA